MPNMDILSHGLWGSAAFYPQKRKIYWLAFLFGVLPDLVSFAPNMLFMLFSGRRFRAGEPPELADFSQMTFTLYDVTHSLIIFTLVFLLVYFLRGRKPFWPMAAWGVHIIMDIPTHSYRFFPTPFLWPISGFKIDGFSWGQPWFLILNYSVLAGVYLVLYLMKRAQR